MEPPGPASSSIRAAASRSTRWDPDKLSLSNMGRLETQKKTYGKIEVVFLLALKNLLGL